MKQRLKDLTTQLDPVSQQHTATIQIDRPVGLV